MCLQNLYISQLFSQEWLCSILKNARVKLGMLPHRVRRIRDDYLCDGEKIF